MNLDNTYIYVFVRQDIPLAAQLVHVGHASYAMGNSLVGEQEEGIPNLVIIGVPHLAAIKKAEKKLESAGIEHFVWSDPDTTDGPTAIATAPICPIKKQALANYRLWSNAPGTAKADCASQGDGRPNAAVAQLREHRTSSPEVIGANPISGSNSTSVNCS